MKSFSLLQQQLMVYVNDHHQDIWLTPRYYFNINQWTRMRFRVRRKELLATNEFCRIETEDESCHLFFVSFFIFVY